MNLRSAVLYWRRPSGRARIPQLPHNAHRQPASVLESNRHRALSRLVLALDAVLVVAAMLVASWLHAQARHHLHVFRDPPSFDQLAVLPFLTMPLFVGWTAGFRLHRLYGRQWSALQLVAGMLQLHTAVFFSLSVLIFLTQTVVNRSLIGLFLACSFVLLLTERAALLAWQRFQYERGTGGERLLLVGGASDALHAFLEDVRGAAFGPRVVGRLVPADADLAAASPCEVPCLGSIGNFAQVMHREAVDHVVFFPPLHRPTDVASELGCCETLGVPASFAIELPHATAAAPRVVNRGRLPFVTLDVAPKSAAALAVKHGVDVLAAGAALVLLAPLLMVIGAAICATMGRPVFFVQERAGLYGRRFRMLKFRTMVRDAEGQQAGLRSRNEMSGPVFKVTRDPRITRLGLALRRSSMDELPQLVNVLLGHMSLVGPRPLPLSEQKAIVGWQRRRLSMKPGLTGLWQVSGRNSVDFEEWMRLDLEYVDRWSLASDLLILLRTIPAVLFARGAR